MTTKAYIIWLFLVAFLPLNAAVPTLNRDDLVVSVRVPEQVTPGKVATFILRVNNDYTHLLNFELIVEKPESWHLLSEPDSIQLQPGESKQIVLLMEIDRACEVGDQNVRFQFYDKLHDIELEEVIVTEVENIHKLEVRATRVPSYLMAGQDFQVDFEIRNLGNCVEEFFVSSDNGNVQDVKYTLAPNTSVYISVNDQVNPHLSRAGHISCRVSIKVAYQQRPIQGIATIKVYPQSTKKSDAYHRLPIRASLIYMGVRTVGPYQSVYQMELLGEGYLDMRHNHKINFTVRAPNQFSVARLGNFNQYSLEYDWRHSATSHTKVRLGDFSYNLTDITEMFRWARGVEVAHREKRFEVGAFYNEPIFFEEVSHQYAVYGKYFFLQDWYVQLSGMEKIYTDDGPSALLGSFQTGVDTENHKVMAEVSSGRRQDTEGIAGSFLAEGKLKRLSYRTHNIYAGPDYPGYYTNSLFSNTFLSYNFDKLSLQAGFFYNNSNPAQDTTFTTAPHSKVHTAGLSFSPHKSVRSQLNYIYRVREDRFPDKKFSYREQAMNYLLTFRNDAWDAQLNMELAHTENLLVAPENNRGATYIAQTRADRNLGSRLRLGLFTQYVYTNRYDINSQSFLFYGANVGYRLNSHLSLRANYRNNYLIEEYNSDRTLLDFGINANYGIHSFSVNSSHALIRNTVNRSDFYLSARYTCRIAAPISRRDGLYTLNGTLQSANPSDAAGVVVHVSGKSVITDENGNFTLNDLKEGTHYLHIDRSTLDIGLLPKTEMPTEVTIYPTGENKVVIELERGATLSGSIHFEMDQSARLNQEKPPSKIVKATNGQQELLTYSDAEGNYTFANVLPGKWRVRILHANDDKWQIKANNITVELLPEETKTLDFEMKRKKRNVHFSKQGLELNMKKD